MTFNTIQRENDLVFDEMLDASQEGVRAPYHALFDWLKEQDLKDLSKHSFQAEELFRRVGITFNVYGNKDGQERLIPFDLIPRILAMEEWQLIERGIIQRVAAINSFLNDVYHRQEIVKAAQWCALPICNTVSVADHNTGMFIPL